MKLFELSRNQNFLYKKNLFCFLYLKKKLVKMAQEIDFSMVFEVPPKVIYNALTDPMFE